MDTITPPAPPAPLHPLAHALRDPGAGWQTSEFILSLAILAAVCVALWQGRIDPSLASLLIGLLASAYPSLRTWLKARHLDTLAQLLAAQGGPSARPIAAIAAGLAQAESTAPDSNPNAAGTASTANPAGATATTTPAATTPLALFALGTALACSAVTAFTGCANAPYYVSGVSAGVSTDPGGQSITGGTVGVTLAPNPAYATAPAPIKAGSPGLKSLPAPAILGSLILPLHPPTPAATPTPTAGTSQLTPAERLDLQRDDHALRRIRTLGAAPSSSLIQS